MAPKPQLISGDNWWPALQTDSLLSGQQQQVRVRVRVKVKVAKRREYLSNVALKTDRYV